MMTKIQILDSKALVQRDTDGRWITLLELAVDTAADLPGADDKAARVAKFKSYLAAQYAAGTPVTIWYVIATPETAVVNEPLMKIGDYADTVSAAQSQVTIPTVNGENVLDVLTEVKPSEVTIKGGISSV